MNGIEKITARIIADAQLEAEAIKSEAGQKGEQIRSDYSKKAQDEYWRIVKAGVAECEARVARLGRAAEMEAKKSVLTLKQDMVSEAFSKAVNSICEMPKEQYIALLAKMAKEASDTGKEEVILSNRDKAIGAEIVSAANAAIGAGALLLSEETSEMAGGFILRDGNVEINCNIETIVEQHRYELASAVAEVMFG